MKKENSHTPQWQVISASVPGSGHIRRGIPCQDASLAIASPRPALIVCDGRGSASHSHFGAQVATTAFQSQIAVFEPMLQSILDQQEEQPDKWLVFSRIIYRTLMQVKLDLASKHGLPEREFDFTVAFAIMGSHHLGCFQVGDGAIVIQQQDACRTVFKLDKGEFANQTQFLRENGEAQGKFQATLSPVATMTGVAITSDGPEHLMFQLRDMTPGPIFNEIFSRCQQGDFLWQDLMDYLTRNEWTKDPRGTDDRSLALMYLSSAAPQPNVSHATTPPPSAPVNPPSSEPATMTSASLINDPNSPRNRLSFALGILQTLFMLYIIYLYSSDREPQPQPAPSPTPAASVAATPAPSVAPIVKPAPSVAPAITPAPSIPAAAPSVAPAVTPAPSIPAAAPSVAPAITPAPSIPAAAPSVAPAPPPAPASEN